MNEKVSQIVFSFAAAVLLFGTSAQGAKAADTIDITKVSSPNKGQIIGEGTFTLDAGHTVKSITMNVYKGGILIKQTTADYDTKNLIWGSLAISLSSGVEYEVNAQAVFFDGLFDNISAPTKKLKITVK